VLVKLGPRQWERYGLTRFRRSSIPAAMANRAVLRLIRINSCRAEIDNLTLIRQVS